MYKGMKFNVVKKHTFRNKLERGKGCTMYINLFKLFTLLGFPITFVIDKIKVHILSHCLILITVLGKLVDFSIPSKLIAILNDFACILLSCVTGVTFPWLTQFILPIRTNSCIIYKI